MTIGEYRQEERCRHRQTDGSVTTTLHANFFSAEGLFQDLREAGFEVDPNEIRKRSIEGYGAVDENSVWLETMVKR
jgi:hypothetical protein